MSEQILLLNPRRKRKARRTKARRRRRVVAMRPRRHRRRRAVRRPRVYATRRRRRVFSRRRRRATYGRRARGTNPRRRFHFVARRRRRGSNPRFGLGRARGLLSGYVLPMAVGGAGGLVLDLAWGRLAPRLPSSVQSGWAGLAAKLGVVLGAAWAMNRFVPRLRAETHRAAIGAGTVLFYGAIKGMAQSVLPAGTPGLSGYMDFHSYALPGSRLNGYMPRTLGSLEDLYSPAAVIQPAGGAVPRQFGSYIAAQPGGLSGYMQPHMSGGGGLAGGYDFSDGM